MLFLQNYVCGIILTDLATEKRLAESRSDNEQHKKLAEMWGSLDRSMLTLYQIVTEGIHWGETMEPLEGIPMITVMFVMYVAFAVFALMNVVTGVFVNKAISAAESDHDLVWAKLVPGRASRRLVSR